MRSLLVLFFDVASSSASLSDSELVSDVAEASADEDEEREVKTFLL